MLLFLRPEYDLAVPDHQEAAIADVGCVQLQVGVRQHHNAGGGRSDDLLFALLHLSVALRQQAGGLAGGKMAIFDQQFAIFHEVRAKLSRVNAVLSPSAHSVRHPDDVCRRSLVGIQRAAGRLGAAVFGEVATPVVNVAGHEVGIVPDLALENVVDVITGLLFGKTADGCDQPMAEKWHADDFALYLIFIVSLPGLFLGVRRFLAADHSRHQRPGHEPTKVADGRLHDAADHGRRNGLG